MLFIVMRVGINSMPFVSWGVHLDHVIWVMVSAEIQSVNRIQTVQKFDWFILLVLL